jgi:cytoskeletal protein RodZ
MKSYKTVVLIVLLIVIIVAIWLIGNYFSQNEAATNCITSGGEYSTTTGTCIITRAPVDQSDEGTSTDKGTSTNAATSSPFIINYTPASAASHIEITSPKVNSTASSPLVITGKARGWYFEGSFPIVLTNASGLVIAQGQAVAQGDWMTNEFVPFRAELSFPKQVSGTRGFLILKKDNPSDMRKGDEAAEMRVVFK